MLASFSISTIACRSRTRSRMSVVTSRKSILPGASRNGSRLSWTWKRAPSLSRRSVSTSRMDSPARARWRNFRSSSCRSGGHRRKRPPEDLGLAEAVEAFRRGVPFRDSQRVVVEGHGAGRGLEEMAVVLAGAVQLLLAAAPLPEHVPGGPRGQQQGRPDAAGDVEIVESEVIRVPEEAVLHQLPDREHQGDDAGARKDQRRPEPRRLPRPFGEGRRRRAGQGRVLESPLRPRKRDVYGPLRSVRRC